MLEWSDTLRIGDAVIDGALAARFTAYLATVLSDIRRTLL